MFKSCIKRDFYLDKIKPYIGKDLIKVLVGQRRCGKSYILYQLIDYIKSLDKKANIIYINKELNEFSNIENNKNLLDYIKEKAKLRKNYLFIDEVQDINNFEVALRSLNASGNFDIYCTGSNAKLLSSEIATYLSGRYIEIIIHPLSYVEFLKFHILTNSDESLLKYIKFGGLPYLINLKLEETIVYEYLKNIQSSILLKDIVARFKIRNIAFFEKLVDYLALNISSIVSAKKISDYLKSQKINISSNVVADYISHLDSAFFINKVSRQDVIGKKIFEFNEKYYFEDLGLRHSICSYKQIEINKVLENLVYNHLKIKGYNIKIGKLNNKEIDFVCDKEGEKLYIQVAYLITEANKSREFDNLLEIPDNYKKVVVTTDSFISTSTYKGIVHKNIKDFLIE